MSRNKIYLFYNFFIKLYSKLKQLIKSNIINFIKFLNNMKEVKKQNEMNKSRIIKKIKFEDKNMISLINEGFENADNYLKINLNLIIGKYFRNNCKNI